MPIKLQDNRKYQSMTAAEADDLYLRIARLKASIDKETAAHKAKLAELELAHKNRIAAALEEKTTLEKELTAYILANPGRFVKPRKRSVGAIGAYGLATDPAYVRIIDAEAAIAFAQENGYDDLLRAHYEIEKDAVLRRAAAGESVPGTAVIGAGDVAKLTFSKGYAEALEN